MPVARLVLTLLLVLAAATDQDAFASGVASYGAGIVASSAVRPAGQPDLTYLLTQFVGNQGRALPVGARDTPFDVTAGTDRVGRAVRTYSRCRIEPYRDLAGPVWRNGRGCDVYRYQAGRERKLAAGVEPVDR